MFDRSSCLLTLCVVLLQAFTTEFRVHWGQHLLRPEFAESTYYLYKVIKLSSFVVINTVMYNDISKCLPLVHTINEVNIITDVLQVSNDKSNKK